MIQEDFKFYKPCRLLQHHVRYYWVFKSNRKLNTLTFPIGCPQIIFHKKAPLYVPEQETFQPALAISGQVDYPSHLCAEEDVEMIVAVFQPYAMKAFLNLPISLLHNQEVSGYDLGNRGLEELAARISDCKSTEACVHMTEQWLLSQMAGIQTPKVDHNMGRMAAAIKLLLRTPETSVAGLAAASCLGKKQFGRLFNDMVGANPKEYARIVRFQKSLKLLQHRPGSINQAQLAYSCGYADQSHLIREFRHFSGHTPLALLNVCEPYSDLFTDPA